MTTQIAARKKKSDIKGLYTSFAKAVIAAIPASLSSDPASLAKNGSAVFINLVDFVVSLTKDTSNQLSFLAWDITRASFATGLARFLQVVELTRRPAGKELEKLVEDILRRFDILTESGNYVINVESFAFPLLLPPVRDASTRIPSEMSIFGPKNLPFELRRVFEGCMVEGFRTTRELKPDLFRALEDHLDGPFALAMEKVNALAAHRAFLIRLFSQIPIFGQENSGITVSDLYVRQRCMWSTVDTQRENKQQRLGGSIFSDNALSETRGKGRRNSILHLGDMHKVIHQWLAEKRPSDAVRVIAGGPGSGKSTFAKAIAIEVIDYGLYDVLFVPLQEIIPKGSFETRLTILYRDRSDLGFDRVDSPITWLARTQHDGSAPIRPLLMICDGLDEIAPPDTVEAANVTTDFIQSLNTWIGSRNSAGCYVKAIILGRNIAAKEAFGKLGIDDQALLNVGGLVPLTENKDWQFQEERNLTKDLDTLSEIDQRLVYWSNWAKCNNINAKKIPVALDKTNPAALALKELTAEPLLLYLLLWTGYLGDKWREAADNKNVVYEEIFKRIYQRDWGKWPHELQRDTSVQSGGHSGTRSLTFDDFMLLQEALGLASWQSGGRTASKSAFDKTLKCYLDEIKFHQLKIGPGVTLKSVALQSYTRSAEDDAGFEFVHKSLSDYLIGRGLFRNTVESLRMLAEIVFDERCKRAATAVANIAYAGAMSVEISKFFSDEMRLRAVDKSISESMINKQFVPLCNWVLANGFPVHESDIFGKEVNFTALEQAQRRAMDVLWTFGQNLALHAYPEDEFESGLESSWSSGPIKLEWPSSTSCFSLFSRLSDRDHCAENGRLATFHRMDLSNQVFTDTSMGAVLFSADAGRIRPSVWLGFKASGSKFVSAAFYSASLRFAELRMCEFTGCYFNSSFLMNANFRNSTFRSCDFLRAQSIDASYARGKFHECKLQGANFRNCDFTESSFKDTEFGRPGNVSARENPLPLSTTFISANFDNATLVDVDFGETDLESAIFRGADLSGVGLSRANIKRADFSNAKLDRTVVSKSQLNRGLIPSEGTILITDVDLEKEKIT